MLVNCRSSVIALIPKCHANSKVKVHIITKNLIFYSISSLSLVSLSVYVAVLRECGGDEFFLAVCSIISYFYKMNEITMTLEKNNSKQLWHLQAENTISIIDNSIN